MSVIHKTLRMKFNLFANATCIKISEKLCIGQWNIEHKNTDFYIKTNFYF